MKEKEMREFVLALYPSAEFSTFFDNAFGKELIFYPTPDALNEYACVERNGQLEIVKEF